MPDEYVIGMCDMRKYFHATTRENADSILSTGIKRGFDGCVYMTKKPEEAARFALLHTLKDAVVIEIHVPDKMVGNIQETFDHSRTFFNCRAFGYYNEDIPVEWLSEYGTFSFKK